CPCGLVALTARTGADDHRGGPIWVDPHQAGAVERRREPVGGPGEPDARQNGRAESAHLHVGADADADQAALGARLVASALQALVVGDLLEPLRGGGVIAGVEGEPTAERRRELLRLP